MKSIIPIKRYSIEDAVVRALPLNQFNWNEERELIQKFAGKGLDAVVGGPTNLISWKSQLEIPNLVIAEVDMNEYFELYKRLLEDPSQIEKYLQMLDSDAREYVVRKANERATLDKDMTKRRYLFGLADHAAVYITPKNPEVYDEVGCFLADLNSAATERYLNSPSGEKDLGNCEHLLLNYWTNENPPRITHSYDPTKPIIVRINSGCTWSPQTLENEKVIAKELREFIEQVKTNPDVESMSLCTGDYGVVLPTYRREQK